MKKYLVLAIIVILQMEAAFGGTITGTVRAQGKEGLEEGGAGGKYDSRKFKFAEKVNYSQMRDFVVYIDQPLKEKPAPPAKPVEVITQKDATFAPHVLPVVLGTTVEWPNRDEIFHNVFSDSEAKQFDLGLYKEEIKNITFDKPGKVDVFCSIHSQMHAVILVLENPYFSSVTPKGTYTIANVPAGTYRLKAWHERMPAQVKEIVVPEVGEVKVDFILGFKNLPKY